MAHEIIGIIVIILAGPDQVERLGRGQRRGRLHRDPDIGIMGRRGERLERADIALRDVGIGLRPDRIDPALGPDDPAEQARPIAVARNQIEHAIAGLEPRKGDQLGRMAAGVGGLVHGALRIGERGADIGRHRDRIDDIGALAAASIAVARAAAGGRGRAMRARPISCGPWRSSRGDGPAPVRLRPCRFDQPRRAFDLRRNRGGQTSRLATFSAFSWMNSRRGSTTSPIRRVKISSATSAWATSTWSSARLVGIERGLPELLGVHLAQALVALDGEALAAGGEDRLEQLGRAGDRARRADRAPARFGAPPSFSSASSAASVATDEPRSGTSRRDAGIGRRLGPARPCSLRASAETRNLWSMT